MSVRVMNRHGEPQYEAATEAAAVDWWESLGYEDDYLETTGESLHDVRERLGR